MAQPPLGAGPWPLTEAHSQSPALWAGRVTKIREPSLWSDSEGDADCRDKRVAGRPGGVGELGMCGHGIDLCGGQGLLILLQGRLRRLRPAANPSRADLKADIDGSLLERGVLGLKVLSLRGRVRGIREGSACVDISQ